MKYIRESIHWGTPLVAILILKIIHGKPILDGIFFIIPNYIIFIIPHLFWLLYTPNDARLHYVRDVGLVVANIVLVSLFMLFETKVNNSNAMGWIFYWPVAYGTLTCVNYWGLWRAKQLTPM